MPGSRERVEFAIRCRAARDDGVPLWLPIDAKFPREDYERLLEAQERADPPAWRRRPRHRAAPAPGGEDHPREVRRAAAHHRLRHPVRAHRGPVRRGAAPAGFSEALQREFRVMLTGPTTLLATLNSLQMGFRTLALEKRSAEVWEVLGAVKTEFGKFGDVLAKDQEEAQTKSVQHHRRRRRAHAARWRAALKTVEAVGEQRTQALLPGLDAAADDEDAA